MMRAHAAISPNRHPERVSGSIPRFAWIKRRKTQLHRQVPPFPVLGIDQLDLALTMPLLELLPAQDDRLHLAEHLAVNQTVDPVSPNEAGEQPFTILHKPLEQVRRDADVDRAVVPVRKQVDASVSLFAQASGRAEEWTLKQFQGDEEGSDLVLFHPRLTHSHHVELVSASIGPQAQTHDR